MKTLASLLAIVALAAGGRAETLTEAQVRAAATQFVTSDDVGSRALGGRTVASVEPRDALWVARLSPSGYVVLSGNTDAEPVLAFATGSYVDPSDDSPFGALLAQANTNATAAAVKPVVRAVSALAASPLASAAVASVSAAAAPTGRRAAKWAELLEGAAATESTANLCFVKPLGATGTTTQIGPWLDTAWDQCQPYNDYSPVCSSAAEKDTRGRVLCGCVATAYAQLLNYWKWPRRLDAVVSYDHVLQRGDDASMFKIRFDGNTPFLWNEMKEEYPCYIQTTGAYDLRSDGYPESDRYAVAHLILGTDVISWMFFGSKSSSSHFLFPAMGNPWFAYGRYSSRAACTTQAETNNFLNAIRENIAARIPVLVALPRHAVVADGWFDGTDGTQYVHLNYGWGDFTVTNVTDVGQNFFNITVDQVDVKKGYIEAALLDHVPRSAVQLEPLPAVSGEFVTLTWRMPKAYAEQSETDNASFRVRYCEFDETTTTNWTENFSMTSVTSSAPDVIYVDDHQVESGDSACLKLLSGSDGGGTVELMSEQLLTADSVLSYKVRRCYALGMDVRIQASVDGRAWEDVDVIPVSEDGEDGSSSWTAREVAMGKWAGHLARLRVSVMKNVFLVSYSGTKDIPTGVHLDDFCLTNVRGRSENSFAISVGDAYLVHERGSDLFSTDFPGTSGKLMSASVVPMVGEGAADLGYVWTRIDTNRAESAAAARPEIGAVTSVSESSAQVQEGFYRECARGKNYFFVNCSTNVTSLEARPSHLTLLPDDKVAVEKIGDGKFAVTVDGSGIDDAFDRSRLVLTLAATDADGGTAYKDLSLRFSSETSAEPAFKPWESAKYTTVSDDAPVAVPFSWLVEKGLVASADATADEMDAAAKLDSDGDGMANCAEYLCGTDPTDAADRLTVSIRMVDDAPQVSWSPTNALARYVVIGVTNLTEKTWTETNGVNSAGMRFFRVRVEPK